MPFRAAQACLIFLGVLGIGGGCRRSRSPEQELAALRPEDACQVLLNGSASIRVQNGEGIHDECIATGMCATSTICPPGETCGPTATRFLEISIGGHLAKTKARCQVSICIPIDPNLSRLPEQFTFDPTLSSRGGPWLQEYLCSGYAEMPASARHVAGTRQYPVPTQPDGNHRWSGRAEITKIGKIGELVHGTFEYEGIDGSGAVRSVHAKFSVPRYPNKS